MDNSKEKEPTRWAVEPGKYHLSAKGAGDGSMHRRLNAMQQVFDENAAPNHRPMRVPGSVQPPKEEVRQPVAGPPGAPRGLARRRKRPI